MLSMQTVNKCVLMFQIETHIVVHFFYLRKSQNHLLTDDTVFHTVYHLIDTQN